MHTVFKVNTRFHFLMLSVVTVKLRCLGAPKHVLKIVFFGSRQNLFLLLVFLLGLAWLSLPIPKPGGELVNARQEGWEHWEHWGVPKLRGTIPVSVVINALYSRHMNCSVTLLTFWTWMPCQTCQDSNWNRYVARIHRVCWARRVAW